MATQSVLYQLNQWDSWGAWLLPGDLSDSRLLHSGPSDRIFVYPSHLGDGYRQQIPLRDDLTLVILDYTLTQNVVIDAPDSGDRLKFEFQLDSGYNFILPDLGLQNLGVSPARRRSFEVEIIVNCPSLVTYLNAYVENLSPQLQHLIKRILQSSYPHSGRCSLSTTIGILKRMFDGALTQSGSGPITFYSPMSKLTSDRTAAIASTPSSTFHHLMTEDLYTEAIEFNYVNRSTLTAAMEHAIGQILTCPYQGATRRTYLERKALELVCLRLNTMAQPRLSAPDRDSISQAASILRNQYVHPPTMDVLARQVYTNRLKLYQGFHQVYGTTPFGYLRDCRIWQAHRLLMTTDLSIGTIAAAVGYTNRNRFAKAFRQKIGINPKAFQMHLWKCAG